VFPKIFFPNLGATMATVASLGMFASAFFARPLGAALFGHFGDRLGRKKTLVATLLMMGLSTLAVGLVPTTATIGVAAPLILLTLRVLQGLAVGGEWAGSALLSAEYAPAAKRGAYGMFTQLGAGARVVLANLVFLGVHTLGGENGAFMQWGWRIPFLSSAVLIVIALYMRLNIAETPVFTDEQGRRTTPKMPIADLLKSQRREVILAAGCVVSLFTLSYIASISDRLCRRPTASSQRPHSVRGCARRAGRARIHCRVSFFVRHRGPAPRPPARCRGRRPVVTGRDATG
jgi:MFS family permease